MHEKYVMFATSVSITLRIVVVGSELTQLSLDSNLHAASGVCPVLATSLRFRGRRTLVSVCAVCGRFHPESLCVRTDQFSGFTNLETRVRHYVMN